jgi:hypothetical protein
MASSMIPVTSEKGNSPQELLRKLEAYHFTKSGLPPSLGGSWSYDYFNVWLSAQDESCSSSGGGSGSKNGTAAAAPAPACIQDGGAVSNNDGSNCPALINAELQSYLQSYSCNSRPLSEETGNTSSPGGADGMDDSCNNVGSCHCPRPAGGFDIEQSSSSLRLTVSTMTTMLSDFYESVDMIPFEQKTAYLEAMEQCPRLVQEESNPKWFLTCEKNNPWAAARRFINYWHQRKALFGQERAFLPMNATGRGALREDEIGSILYGALSFLPNNNQDRPLIWYDRAKPISKAGRLSRLRWWFYAMSVVHELESAQRNGVMLLIIFNSDFFKQTMVASMAPDLWEMIRTSFPIRKLHIHIVCEPSQDLTLSMIESGLPFLVERCGRDAVVHKAETKDELLQRLETHLGMQRSGIPVEFGGTWSEKDHDVWREARLRREWERQEKYSRSVSPTSSRKLGFGRSGGFRMKKGRFFTTASHNISATDCIKELQEAIDGMDADANADYLYAVRTVPNIVQAESNPEVFLAVENQDAIAAAVRLVSYWRRRREIFGGRAFLPLNLSERGVMTAQDMVALEKGFLLCLPQDAQGTSVLWMSGQPDVVEEIRLRILFYMLHVVCENGKTQEGGFVMLHALSEETCGNLKFFDDLVRQAFPARLAAVHLISTESAATARSVDVIIPAAMQILSKPFLDNTFLHLVQTEDEMLGQLEWCGFTTDGLPSVVGGDIVLEEFLAAWIRGRNLAESSLPEKVDAGSCDHSVSSSVVCMSDARVQRSSVEDMEEAIMLLPDADKEALLEAKEKVPDLVAKESNPSWYLQHEKYDVFAASYRLAAYWKKRKSIFGKRAFLPMNMTGEGALSREAVAYLSTGSLVFLPEDNKGRSILCYDTARTGETDLGPQLEVMLYLALLCAQNNVSQVEGVVILLSMNKDVGNEHIPDMLDAGHVLPFSWHSVHVISKAAETVFDEAVVPWAKNFLDLKLLNRKAVIHRASIKKEILEKLQSHGFVKAGLPQSLGGEWSYAQHARWQEQRIRIEWDLPITGSDAAMFQSTAKRRRDLTEEEKIERKRRYNVIHSRRKRQRDRVEVEVLREQVEELKDSNESMQQDNEHLERLLEKAQAIVNKHTTGADVLDQKVALPVDTRKSAALKDDTASETESNSTKASAQLVQSTSAAITWNQKKTKGRSKLTRAKTAPTAGTQSTPNAKRQRVSSDSTSAFELASTATVSNQRAPLQNAASEGGEYHPGSDLSHVSSKRSVTIEALGAVRSSDGTKRKVTLAIPATSATVNALRAARFQPDTGGRNVSLAVPETSPTVNALRSRGVVGTNAFICAQQQPDFTAPSTNGLEHPSVDEGLGASTANSQHFHPINAASLNFDSQQVSFDTIGLHTVVGQHFGRALPSSQLVDPANAKTQRRHVAGVSEQGHHFDQQAALFASQTVTDAPRSQQRSNNAADYTGISQQQQQQQMGLAHHTHAPEGFRLFSIQHSNPGNNFLQCNSFLQGQPKTPGQNAPILGLPRNPLVYGRPQNLHLESQQVLNYTGGFGTSASSSLEQQQPQHQQSSQHAVQGHTVNAAAAATALTAGSTTSLTGDERLDMLVRRIAEMSNNGQAAMENVSNNNNLWQHGRMF